MTFFMMPNGTKGYLKKKTLKDFQAIIISKAVIKLHNGTILLISQNNAHMGIILISAGVT